MFANSTVVKNKSSAEKRTATALRTLASATGTAPADAAVLAKAAAIVERYASQHAKEAKAKKAAEEKWARDYSKALATIEPQVKALIGTSTLEQVVAAVAMARYRIDSLRKSICEAKTAKDLKWDIDYWTNDGITYMVDASAAAMARGQRTADEALAIVRTGLDKGRTDPVLIALAKSVDAALARLYELEAA